jgi:hypothetical protein
MVTSVTKGRTQKLPQNITIVEIGSILNSILVAHWLLFVTSAHSREVGSSKDRQPGVYRELVVNRQTGVPGIGGEKVKDLHTPGRGENQVASAQGYLETVWRLSRL